MVSRGLAESRARAQALIMAGSVESLGEVLGKCGQQVLEDIPLTLKQSEPWVGRGYLKLQGALDQFSVGVENRVAADIGSSTGGFTQCLLDRGARFVHAVDSGSHQLHEKLRTDERVGVHEQTNARNLGPGDLDPRPDLAVMDVSFIGTPKIWPALAALLPPPGELISLVKPQFEAQPAEVGRGGVVQGLEKHTAIISRWHGALRAQGALVTHFMVSPVRGGKAGNVEYLARILLSPGPQVADLGMPAILETLSSAAGEGAPSVDQPEGAVVK